MSDLNEASKDDRESVCQDIGASKQPSVKSKKAVDTEASQDVQQRSQRIRKLTEKGQKLHDEKLERYEQRFRTSYEKWKSLIKESKRLLAEFSSNELLQDVMTRVIKTSRIDIPDHDTRRRVDTCEAVTRRIVDLVKSRLEGNKESESRRALSEMDITSSDKSSVKTRFSKASAQSRSKSRSSSKYSILSAAKRQEAAAEVAANEAILKVLWKQDQQLEELQKLEAEDKRLVAEQEAETLKRREEESRMRVKHEMENAARHKLLEDKRRELERLETLKKLNAAKARMQIYEQRGATEENLGDLFHDCEVKEIKVQKRHRQHRNLRRGTN